MTENFLSYQYLSINQLITHRSSIDYSLIALMSSISDVWLQKRSTRLCLQDSPLILIVNHLSHYHCKYRNIKEPFRMETPPA